MTSEYTPTVAAFRGIYGQMCAEWCRDDALAEFDRFIARVRAEAWDEGAEAFEAAHRWDIFEPWQHLIPNPYQEGESDE